MHLLAGLIIPYHLCMHLCMPAGDHARGFPQIDVMVWYSTYDLRRRNRVERVSRPNRFRSDFRVRSSPHAVPSFRIVHDIMQISKPASGFSRRFDEFHKRSSATLSTVGAGLCVARCTLSRSGLYFWNDFAWQQMVDCIIRQC